MSIRPVDFNGMIQNTNEISHMKANEDNKAALQQEGIQTIVHRQEENATTTVHDMEDAGHHEYNYKDGKGNGGDSSQKRRKSKATKDLKKDGKVTLKQEHPSFDIKI